MEGSDGGIYNLRISIDDLQRSRCLCPTYLTHLTHLTHVTWPTRPSAFARVPDRASYGATGFAGPSRPTCPYLIRVEVRAGVTAAAIAMVAYAVPAAEIH